MARGLARKVSERHSRRNATLPGAISRFGKGGRGRRVLEATVVMPVHPAGGPPLAAGAVSLFRRGRALRVASELSLVVALALALGASCRDGIPTDDYGLAGPVPAAAAPTCVPRLAAGAGQQGIAVG